MRLRMCGSLRSHNLLVVYDLQVFRKGSPLVHDISWAIEKLREEGDLAKLESKWFHSKPICAFEDSTNCTRDALNLSNFGGLFLISFISSTLALVIFLILLLKKNSHLLTKYWKFGYLKQQVSNVQVETDSPA